MTKRALTIGLLLAAGIAGFYYINQYVVMQSSLIGSFMPVSVYGFLVLTLIIINPLLAKIAKSAPLRGAEYAVIISIALVSCAIPGSGFLRFFPNSMMLPHNYSKTEMGWRSEGALQMVPGYMIAGSPPQVQNDDFQTPLDVCATLIAHAQNGTLSPQRARIWEVMSEDKKDAIKTVAGKHVVAQDTPKAKEPTGDDKADDETDKGTPEAKDGPKEETSKKREPKAAPPSDKSKDAKAPLTPAQIAAAKALADGFNSLLDSRELYTPDAFPGLKLSDEVDQIFRFLGHKKAKEFLASSEAVYGVLSEPPARSEQVRIFNRNLIDAAWQGDIKSRSSRRNEEVGSYLMGLQNTKGPARLNQIPWTAWKRPLKFWIPVVLVMSIGVLCLSLIVHTQWSKHEMLPYPLVRFTTALLPGDEGNTAGVLKTKGFWWAFGVVVGVYMLNYGGTVWPEYLFKLPLVFDFSAFGTVIPGMDTGWAKWAVWMVRISPLVIGLAFLIRSDVALSVGLSVPLNIVFYSILGYYGISMAPKFAGRGYFALRGERLFIAGAYIAFMGQIIYTGRSYYLSVFKKAFGVQSDNEVGPAATWGARIFMISALAMWGIMGCSGIDWILAGCYTLLAFMLFLVMSRVLAETGVFLLIAGWYPGVALLGLLGINAIGPNTAILMFMFSSVLMLSPGETLMPFAVGGLKLLDDQKVKTGRMIPWFAGAIILALLIAVPISLKYTHGEGYPSKDGLARAQSRYPFMQAVQMRKFLRSQDRLERVEQLDEFSRISAISPEPKMIAIFLIGLCSVAFLSFARIRWRWWPFHPVLAILFFTMDTTVEIWHSFFIGWLLRKIVMKYGGQRSYSMVLPIVMGLIAGDIVGKLLPNLIGVIYYFTTGDRLVDGT